MLVEVTNSMSIIIKMYISSYVLFHFQLHNDCQVVTNNFIYSMNIYWTPVLCGYMLDSRIQKVGKGHFLSREQRSI